MSKLFPKVTSRHQAEIKKQRRLKLQGEIMIGLAFGMLIFMCLTIQL